MKKFRILGFGLLFGLYGSVHAQSVGLLSLSFEENQGQGPVDARFLARGHGYNIIFTPEGNHLLLRHDGHGVSVTTEMLNANRNAVVRGERKLAGKVHYLRGAASLIDIPTYGRVRYERVYAGIDLVYYGNEQRLEYDFIVYPGGDPGAIALRFDGVDRIMIDDHGDLVLSTDNSQIVQHKPVVYQQRRNARQEIEGAYRLLAGNTVAFDIGPYDPNATLVIDPVLTYSTFLGGGNGDDDARAVTTDSAGNLYVTGSTTSTNFQTAFPIQPNAGSQDPTAGISDAFVTKLNAAGTALVYSTYFGGSSDEDANGIAVDANGNVAITGTTASTDFPTSVDAVRRTCNLGPSGCLDAFVVSLNAAGSAVLYSTYLGGTGDDEARGVAFDSAGNAHIIGRTDSPDFPTTAGVYSTDPESGGFLTKFGPGGSVVYSTYFRTVFGPADPRGIAVDTFGNVYITGAIVQLGSSTGTDVFLTKMNHIGTAVIYTQTLRGSKDETGKAVAIDAAGNAYVTGETNSINLPTTTGVPQSAYGGGPAFRTSDSGSNWSVSRTGMNRASLFALAAAPGTPSTLYAGADDEVAGALFKSTNGGDSWTGSSSGIADARIHALAVDPAAPATVYAGSRTGGVFKSTNAGSTWTVTALNNAFVTALAIDPTATATIYAGTDADGIYKSMNGGTSWFRINSGLVAAPVRNILLDPTASTTVYAATSAGVYKSINGGLTWVASSSGLLDPNVNVVVADARTPNVLLAGTNSLGIFRSSNGGALWVPANGGLTSSSAGISVSALTFDPVAGTLYAAAGVSNAMQIYKSSNGTAWTAANLSTTRITALSPSAGTVFAATVGGYDAFVAKWNASGSLVFATYLGGYRDDAANAIAVDLTGGIYVAGSTSSTNFPISNPIQFAFRGGSGVIADAFATKLDAAGTELSFSTYLGGSSDDFGKGITVDSSNTVYVVGVSASSDFPTISALNSTRLGLLDAFIVKIGEGSAIAYAVPIRGGFIATSQGIGSTFSIGYARIQQGSGGSLPSGLAIFGLRQNNVLVSEAAVPASTPIGNGRIYAEIGGNVSTGIAIANPNPAAVTVVFYFTDSNGQSTSTTSLTIPANGQIARFLDQSPFNGPAPFLGSFTFASSQPVAVIALRGFTNERGEFLLTTLPVADLSVAADTEAILFPHFADGGGWTTQILLVNTTDGAMTGSIQFAGLPSQNYSITPRSAVRIATPGTAGGTLTGSARLVPAAGTNTPVGVAVFSYKKAGVVTVTEAGVLALRAAPAFRLYAESSGVSGQPGSIRTGIAIANPSGVSANVLFELTTITGVSTGLTTSVVLPGNGQLVMFLDEIPGFAGVPNPFQGVLRISTSSSAGMTVVGLRGRYNERQDFLITTTQPTNEAAAVNLPEQFFAHFADGGGYTTQFILYNGSANQPSSGVIRFVGQNGQSLSLGVH